MGVVVPRVREGWHVVCFSTDLGKKPLATKLFDQPIVVFRTETGAVSALEDRCPHRNVPLSMGTAVGEDLQCVYHGWRFARSGKCTAVPGLSSEDKLPTHCVPSFPAVEKQGCIWVWGSSESEPVGDPFTFPYADRSDYLTVRKRVEAMGSVHAVAENALDVPHTAFVHGGLFRNDKGRQPIQCVVKRFGDRVECEYIGEARPDGLAGRILSPSGGEVVHFDRFYLPGIIEVEYRIGEENHIVLSGALTPIGDHETQLHAVVSAKTRIPVWLVRPLVQPLAEYIFGQDKVVLSAQSETMESFGEAGFVSTEIDLLGPHILALLKRAAAGKIKPDAKPSTREVTLLV